MGRCKLLTSVCSWVVRAGDVWYAHSHKDTAQTTVGIKGDSRCKGLGGSAVFDVAGQSNPAYCCCSTTVQYTLVFIQLQNYSNTQCVLRKMATLEKAVVCFLIVFAVAVLVSVFHVCDIVVPNMEYMYTQVCINMEYSSGH